MRLGCLVPTLLSALFVSGCLPGDTRPPPGRIFLTAEPSPATTQGILTEDGWSIHVERILAGLGDGSLEGDGCNDYANARYDRVFDFAVPGSQKLCEVYGLGVCDVQVRLRTPSRDSLLERGVTSSDLEFMRLPDPNEPIPVPTPTVGNLGTSVYVRGQATRGSLTKRFAWRFHDRFSLSNCGTDTLGPFTSAVSLEGGDDKTIAVTLHAEELFRESAADSATLRFDLLASADADEDGEITMAELAKVESPITELDAGVGDAGAAVDSTLAGLLSQKLAPRMVFLDGAPCQVQARRGR